jgi:hypothetical protein
LETQRWFDKMIGRNLAQAPFSGIVYYREMKKRQGRIRPRRFYSSLPRRLRAAVKG